MQWLLGNIVQPVTEVKPICLQSAVKNTVEMLGKSHVLEILYFLSKRGGPVRFNELNDDLFIHLQKLETIICFEVIR